MDRQEKCALTLRFSPPIMNVGVSVQSTLIMRSLRIGLGQINATVGDLDGNVAKIVDYARRARDLGCDVVAFPELAVTGYPPEDLLLRRSFIVDTQAAVERLAREAPPDIAVIAGCVDEQDDIYNAAAV